MIDEPQSDVLCLITSYCNSYWNFLFTSLVSSMDCLYSPMFGNGDSRNNYITLSTYLLGSNPFGFCNTSLCLQISSNWCFFLLLHLSSDAFTSIHSPLGCIFLKKSNKKILLELIGLLVGWDLLEISWIYLVHIDDEGFFIPDQVVSVWSPREDHTPNVNVGASKHFTIYIKW